MSKASKFRDMAIVELDATLNDIRKEIFFMTNEMRKTKKNEKPHLIREKKKDIARLLTVKNEKQSLNP